jgi:hypothetical protein
LTTQQSDRATGPRRALLPEPVCNLDAENDATIGHIFENDCELLTLNPDQLSASLDELESYVAQMDKSKFPRFQFRCCCAAIVL